MVVVELVLEVVGSVVVVVVLEVVDDDVVGSGLATMMVTVDPFSTFVPAGGS